MLENVGPELRHLQLAFTSYRTQPLDLSQKSNVWFLNKGKTGFKRDKT